MINKCKINALVLPRVNLILQIITSIDHLNVSYNYAVDVGFKYDLNFNSFRFLLFVCCLVPSLYALFLANPVYILHSIQFIPFFIQLPIYEPGVATIRPFLFPFELQLTQRDIADILNWVLPLERVPVGLDVQTVISEMCEVQSSGVYKDW